MAENKSQDPVNPVDLENPELRHEASDVDTWAIGKFAIALVLLSIVSMAGLFGLYRYLIQQEGGPVKVANDRFELDARARPPAPQLEETPVLDLERERAAENELLTTYGWLDKQSGTVRIPIDRAIDLVAQRGLPSRPAPATTDHATVPTASGMGEIMTEPGGPLAAGGGK